MKNASQYLALASLFVSGLPTTLRKMALLGQAERCEDLAAQELASHFEECHVGQSSAKSASDLAA